MDSDMFTLIAEMEAHLENCKKVPFTNQYMVDRDALIALAQQMRDVMPEAIKEANRVLKQESRIMQDAKKHYDNLVAEAEAKAKSLRMESQQRAEALATSSRQQADELLAESHRRADEMLNAAERKAEKLVSQTAVMTRAEQQANEMLANARGEAQRLRMMALDHCTEMFKRAEDEAITVANELRDARMQLDQER